MAEHLREDGSYIVIGASGGLGKSIASWLASHGARNIILVCRQKGSIAGIQGQIDGLREKGINVHAVQCDISDKEQVETVLLGQLREMPAVVGVIHSAMILRVSALLSW